MQQLSTSFQNVASNSLLPKLEHCYPHHFKFDTIHMPCSHKGMHFLMQAVEPAIGWVKARAARCNTAFAWATFIYEEIICHFGCIPYCVVDNGSEFQAAAKILLEQYGIVIIVSSPYHPQGNAIAE
jgi:hypothetical protein